MEVMMWKRGIYDDSELKDVYKIKRQNDHECVPAFIHFYAFWSSITFRTNKCQYLFIALSHFVLYDYHLRKIILIVYCKNNVLKICISHIAVAKLLNVTWNAIQVKWCGVDEINGSFGLSDCMTWCLNMQVVVCDGIALVTFKAIPYGISVNWHWFGWRFGAECGVDNAGRSPGESGTVFWALHATSATMWPLTKTLFRQATLHESCFWVYMHDIDLIYWLPINVCFVFIWSE